MATSDRATHLPALGHHEREEIGHQLQSTLIDLIDLSLIGKQLHWNVVGPLFRPLHLHLDELVDSWRELSDTVAERAVALGFAPDGQSRTVAGSTSIPQLTAQAIEDRVALRELTGRVADTAERIRERMDRLGELDSASEDVLIEVVRALEEQLWMLRAQFAR
jgi:starvation-inducible DNA-binding protein